MYCSYCKVRIDTGNYCPICGRRLSPNEFNAGAIVDERVIEDRRSVRSRGPRFNFSKPLCLFFALLLVALMILPWFSVSVSVSGVRLLNEKKLGIFELRAFVKSCYEATNKLIGSEFVLTEQGERIVWLVNGALIAVTLYFGLAAVNIILFGIIGLFTKGRLRYFFARVGSTALFIGTLVMIASVFTGGHFLARFLADPPADLAVQLGGAVDPVVWLFVCALAAILFRTLGIRLLRYLNGVSSMNRGDYRTAEREFTIINAADKLPRTFSKAKHRRGARHNTYGSREDYGDHVVG